MSRRSGEHAKTTGGYEARHAKPGAPGPAALLGTAAKAVPVTLAAGAAGSALVLSGTASAATVPAGLAGGSLVSSGAADVAAMKTAHIVLTRAHHAVHHAGHRSAYTVVSGDTLSRISARFCGTSSDYLSLAGASGITNPNLIYPGQTIKLKCHAAPLQLTVASNGGAHRSAASHADGPGPARPARPARGTGRQREHRRPGGIRGLRHLPRVRRQPARGEPQQRSRRAVSVPALHVGQPGLRLRLPRRRPDRTGQRAAGRIRQAVRGGGHLSLGAVRRLLTAMPGSPGAAAGGHP